MPPPPPPPPAPPPFPKQPLGGSNTQSKSNNFEPPPDRNALLSQIRKGTRLKKAETNDRSTPLIEGSKSSSTNGAAKPSVGSKSNGPFPVIPPGGLFAQGIPKLRPTTRNGESLSQSTLKIQSIKSGSSTSSLDHLRVGQLSGSRSQPPSPVSKPRMSSGVTSSYRTAESTNTSSGNPSFPDDISIKGPAPAPPPASQKPVFKNNANAEQMINKPSTVKRSASQTNLGQRPRLTRPPPNVKPPPPPKSNATPPQSGPPPPPSKPPNILRRQSFGVGESHNSRFAANKLSVANNDVPKPPVSKSIGPPPPPPPPRNNSAPNDLNQMVASSSPSNQWSKMSTAPPPPPNRAVATGNRGVPIRPPPPRAPAPPPPPPQHQFNSHPAPPSQMKAMLSASLAPPPPPARVSSMKQTCEFEDRFKFQPAQSLPKPDKYPSTQKSYPSKANHSRQKQGSRRLPPPPPPQTGTNLTDSNRGQSIPQLHIQLNPGIFSNNYAHS